MVNYLCRLKQKRKEMNMEKKIVKTIITLSMIVMMLSMISTVVLAAESETYHFNTSIVTDKTTLNPGEEFEVDVNMSKPTNVENGIIALGGKLNYDTNILTLEEIEGKNGWNLNKNFYNPNNSKFVTDNQNFVKEAGTIFTIKFKVKENVKPEQRTMIKVENITASNGKTLMKSNQAQLEINVEEPVKEDKITSDKYLIEPNYISKIVPGTTVKVFKQNVTTESDLVFIDQQGNQLGEDDIITTSTILKVGKTLQYTLSVIGDIDGNGVLDVNDLAKLKLHYIDIEELEGEKFKAADLDQNGEIGMNDIAQLKLVLIGFMVIE